MSATIKNQMATTAPRSGIDARVGREMARDGGWIMRRTKRAEELIAQPAIMAEADRLACFIERYAEIEGVEVKELLAPEVLPTRSKAYISIVFAAHECSMCGGTGRVAEGQYCPTCEGCGAR